MWKKQISGLVICVASINGYADEIFISPKVRSVRFERISGGVEKSNGQVRSIAMSELPASSYQIVDDVYRSNISRITLRIPRISDEVFVDVREAVPYVRPDGNPATSHVIFDHGGTKPVALEDDALSAIVVTRLPDNESKDAKQILNSIDGGVQSRASYIDKHGFKYHNVNTKYGSGVLRLVRNRQASFGKFPYQIDLINDKSLITIGSSLFLLIGLDSFVEFSQIYPCKSSTEEECMKRSFEALMNFFGGVKEFRVVKQPVSGSSSN